MITFIYVYTVAAYGQFVLVSTATVLGYVSSKWHILVPWTEYLNLDY